jgi:hypothetical protein
VGLRLAHTDEAEANHGKVLDNPTFTILITPAGGTDKISRYCADLLGKQSRKSANLAGNPTRAHSPDETRQKGKPNGSPLPARLSG